METFIGKTVKCELKILTLKSGRTVAFSYWYDGWEIGKEDDESYDFNSFKVSERDFEVKGIYIGDDDNEIKDVITEEEKKELLEYIDNVASNYPKFDEYTEVA